MNGTSGFQAGYGKTISAHQSFDGLHVWDKSRTLQQDAQKGQTSHPPNPGASRRAYSQARPQQAKWRCVLCSLRGASERSENAAGGLFQHPARNAVFYLPITITHRFLNGQRHKYKTGFWHLNLAIQVLSSMLLWLSCLSSSSQAQVPPPPNPITSSGLNTQVNLAATPPAGKVQYNITGGTRPGGGPNLFHSFGQFNVPHNNIANFLNDSGLATSNILGRVTGGNTSNIFGTIQTTGFGNANLFLINPAGFLFGPNATVNVGGMVAFTSADYLRLADGVRFNAVPDVAADALLSAAPVAAFGFLGSNPGAITVQGSQLTVADGTGISLVGGNLTIQSGTSDGGTAQPARLSAPNGKIQLASTASPGEFDAATLQALPNVDGASFTSFGSVSLAPGSTVNISGTNTVSIRGGQFVLSVNDSLLSTADSAGPPEAISLSPNSSIISSNAGADPGADVQIIAGNLQMDGASIQSLTTGAGNAGAITIAAEESVSLLSGSFITASSFFGGNSGPVTITAPTVSLQDSGIVTLAQGFGSDLSTVGAGTVTITASKSLSLVNFRIDSSSTDTAGNAGRISLTSPIVSLSNRSTISSEASNSSFNPDGSPVGLSTDGNGGIVELAVGQLSMTTGSSIVTQTSGGGQGGSVIVHGLAGPGSKTADVTITSGSVVSTNATDIGSAGNITVDTAQLTLSGGGSMQAATIGPGAGGSITIRAAEQVTISGEALVCPTCAVGQRTVPSQLIASSAADGRAGDILVKTPSLTLTDGGRIFASASGAGPGGTVTVLGPQGADSRATSVMVSGQSSEGAASEISTETHGSGAGGNIVVNAYTVTLQNGGTLSASSTGQVEHPGNAGNIEIIATNGLTMQNSAITTQAGQGASGGNIKVTTSPEATVWLQNSTISASVADGLGGGGNISIDPQFVILQNSQILAQAAQGQGGRISITTGLFLPDANSIVNADSGSGLNGTVTIQSPNAPASGKIQPLGKSPLQATSLLNQRCASLAGGEFSSFTVGGRDNLPTEPGSWLASPLATLSAGMGLKAEGVRPVARGEGLEGETALLSLRQIAPPGFLTQAFAVDWSAGCPS